MRRRAPRALVAQAALVLLAPFAGLAPLAGLEPAAAVGGLPATPPRISAILVRGNRFTSEALLRRELGLRPGDAYDRRAVQRARARLEALEFVLYADVLEKRPQPDRVELVVSIVEAPRLGGGPRVAYERRFDLLAGARVWWRNFGGRGEELSFEATGGKLLGLHPECRLPAALPGRVGLRLDATWERYRFVYQPLRFADRKVRGSLWRDLPANLRLSGYYEYRSLRVDESDFAGAADGTTVDPAMGVEIEHDSRNVRSYPRRGLHLLAGSRFAGVGRNTRYRIDAVEGAAFASPHRRAILAGRVRWQGASDPLPFYERIYLGGPGDLRGIDFGSIRGDEMLLATLEVRLPVRVVPLERGAALGAGVHAFRDWGKAWGADRGSGDVPWHRSWGLGVHFVLGTYQLRFEWARAEDRRSVFQFEDYFTF
jgi:outer membrane protein assembly factor BamA